MMELDFKGIWRCRNGKKVHILELETFNDPPEEGDEDERFSLWRGEIIEEDDVSDWWFAFYWDLAGKSKGNNGCEVDSSEWDLMERISERWSSERSGGENG